MNQSEYALIAFLTEIKDGKIGFLELSTDLDEMCADIQLDARYDFFTSECIFDACSDAQAKQFLESFVAKELSVGWDVCLQLSKLLSTRGHLVSETLDQLLTTQDWNCYGSHQLLLSYLAVREDGPTLAIRFLDQVPEDSRDGLFLACYKLQSEALDKKLLQKFMAWGAENWPPGGTGELYALGQFIAKWIGLYPYRDLEAVIRLYFSHWAET